MTHTPKVSLTVRVESSDLEDWQRRANLRGLSISEWVRRSCNQPGNGVSREDSANQDALGTTEVLLDGRRTRIDKRSRGNATPTQKELGRSPETGLVFSGVPVPVGRDRATDGDVAPVKHTAESNWLTCPCPSCTKRREVAGIALGEIPTKKQRFKRK